MSKLYAIERSIISSIVNFPFNDEDKKILEVNLDPDIFEDQFFNYLVRFINELRLKKLPTDLDYIQGVMISKGIWTIEHERRFLEIMSFAGFGSYGTFIEYLNLLKQNYKETHTAKVQL